MKPGERYLRDEQATLALGAELADLLTANDGFRSDALVFLSGDLGAGKTTLVRGALRALGFAGPVKSPTYTLLEPYEEHRLYHFDFYRIGDSQELDFIGTDDYLAAKSIKLIEWPERAGARLPKPDIEITLQTEGDGRRADVRFPALGFLR